MNKAILISVLSNIPSHIKPVPYLMDVLDLSKKSVYRRINGEIPFTMEELSKLSLLLDFSVDKIVEQMRENLGFLDFENSIFQDPSDSFCSAINRYYELVERLCNSQSSEIIICMNRLPATILVSYPSLIRFKYFQWMHQMSNLPLSFCFDDAILPKGLISKYKSIEKYEELISNIHIIIDSSLFYNIVKDIEYYYKRNLISPAELELLKKDIFDFLDFFEKTTRNGVNHKGSEYKFYISSLDIDFNSSFFKTDDDMQSNFFIHSMNTITITDPETCNMHRKWLNSLKKYATMVSGSNESQLAEFYNKQYNLIDSL